MSSHRGAAGWADGYKSECRLLLVAGAQDGVQEVSQEAVDKTATGETCREAGAGKGRLRGSGERRCALQQFL